MDTNISSAAIIPVARGARIVWALVVVSLAIRITCALKLELFLDEAVYAWMGLHAPMDFAPQPPGTGFLARLGIALIGRGEFGVRLLALVFGTAVVPLAYLLAKSVAGERCAAWAAIGIACVPMYTPMGFIMSCDGPQLALWTAALWLAWHALNGGKIRWWPFLGLVIGLGLYVKYVIVLFFPCLLLCILLVPGWRRLLATPGPWLAVVVAGVVFVPVFLWREHSAGWSSVRFHLSDRHARAALHIGDLFYYIGMHFLYVSPVLFAASVAVMIWMGWRGMQLKDPRLLFLFSFSAPLFLFFLVWCALTERITGREHWDAPAYIAALIGAAMFVTSLSDVAQTFRRSRNIRIVAAAGIATGALLLSLLFSETMTGIVTRAVGRQVPMTNWFVGWKTLADTAEQRLKSSRGTFILFDTWFTMFPCAWYLDQTVRYYTLTDSREVGWGMRRPIERWGFAQNQMAPELGHDALFVFARPVSKPGRPERMERITKMFQNVREEKPVQIFQYGRKVKEFRIFRCHKLKSI
ncbi:MAG: glycosyltransferase family 39 protein [Candidatus Sumerlaeaceae bacterium]